MSHRVPIVAAALLAVAAPAACGGEGGAATAGSGSAASNRGLPQGSEPVTLDPTDFTKRIDKGHVWYLGEDTAEYRDGRAVNRAGSFEAGVGGAQPGVAMPADPQPGLCARS